MKDRLRFLSLDREGLGLVARLRRGQDAHPVGGPRHPPTEEGQGEDIRLVGGGLDDA